tara:strand:+ start:2470 stop:4578 length:2109 start_codon:yes stop_codon:yes gene_type:complete
MAENNNIPQGANKYSVYAQRNVESTQVDWNKIAGDLTKTAESIRDERQGRKDAIDTETQNSMEQLSKIEGTNNQDAASLLINGSSMSVEALRVQSNMLKRGLIKPKDYKLFMQQQKNGYASLNTAVKGWDQWATVAKERLKIAEGTLGPKAGGLEIYQNNLTSALGNLKNKKIWSNPINGQLQLVTMGKDKGGSYNVMPDYYKNKSAYQSPNTMNDLMKYQQDRFDLKNVTKGITSKVGQIIKAFVSGPNYNVLTGGGAIKTVSDFRQFGQFGTDLKGKKITYDQWKEKQIDTITGRVGDRSNENAGQILFNSGGYQYAQTIEEFRENNPGLEDSYWIKADNSGSRPEIELNEEQVKEARLLADTEIESQIAHVESLTKGASGQQETKTTGDDRKLRDKQKAYFGDINSVITGFANEGAAVSEDRITNMNQGFLNSANYTDRNTKINSIDRNSTQIIIDKTIKGRNKSEQIDKFFRDPETNVLDMSRPLKSKDIARKIYRELIPRNAMENLSFDDFYDAALESGMDFTAKEIKGANGKMIPNPDYGGDEGFATKRTFDKLSNYSSGDNISMDPKNTETMSDEFGEIPGSDFNSQEKAAPVVLKAFNLGLDKLQKSYGSSLDIKVSSKDESGSTNSITVTYKDPVTEKQIPVTFKYKEDNAKLQSDVDAEINKIIDAYNTSKSNKKSSTSSSGKLDVFGNPIK